MMSLNASPVDQCARRTVAVKAFACSSAEVAARVFFPKAEMEMVRQ
jgi:hypothetical protein